jgi:gliding motility-associatede transport system auxiliary component
VQGHGEHSPDGSDRAGYSAVAGALKNDNFAFDKLVLAQGKEVPPDASVLVVAGPKGDFLPAEVDMLKAYLARGGKLLLMIDPPDRPDSPQPTSLIALAKDWAIDIGDDLVVDVSGVGQLIGTGPSVPVVARYDQHPITDRFGMMTAYPLARSVSSISAGVNGRFAQNLVETSQNSWAEKDIKGVLTSGTVKLETDKGDKAGPVSLAAAVSAPVGGAPPPDPAKKDDAPKPETRLVAFGDSDFVSNGALGIQGNKDLFLNAVNWLAQQENLISIRPRDPQDRRITLTAERERQVFWLAVVVIPGLILVGGIQTWWRRR